MTALDPAPSAPLERVEWRVDSKPLDPKLKVSRCRYVPYLNAPIVASLLDGWVGPGGWKDEYTDGQIAGKAAMWCHLSVRVGIEWVTKSDVGVASNMEPQKGAVSDAFKRAACLKWGVGRNVYDLPTLWGPCKVSTKGNGEAVAWFDPDRTPDDLLRQLKSLGFDGAGVSGGGGIETPSDIDPETGEVLAVPEPVDVGDVQQITDVLNGIADEDVRKATKQEFVALFGRPADLTTDKVEAAYKWINEAVPA